MSQQASTTSPCAVVRRVAPFSVSHVQARPMQRRRLTRLRAEAEPQPTTGQQQQQELDNPESEAARKKAEADRLRAAERFMMVGTGEAECKGCAYVYNPKKGDPEYPVAPGTAFNQLPEDWQCPVCGADKPMFVSRQKEVAGFVENQGYGFGTNTMTGDQKSLLIFGGLGLTFLFFLSLYTLN